MQNGDNKVKNNLYVLTFRVHNSFQSTGSSGPSNAGASIARYFSLGGCGVVVFLFSPTMEDLERCSIGGCIYPGGGYIPRWGMHIPELWDAYPRGGCIPEVGDA